MGGKEFDGVANSLSSCCWDVAVIVAEMVHGRSDVKSGHAMVGPGAAFLWSFVDDDFASWWSQGCFVKVKDSPDLGVR